MTYMNREHLLNLADRCEAGANELQLAADDPAAALAERGYHDQPDVQEWGARKAAAAAAARQYAEGLRAEAASMGESERPSEDRIRQAEKVADAANLDGILIDGSRLTESSIEHGWHDEAGKQALRDHQAAEDAAVEGSGVFEHVPETINGVEQVPFWQLGHTDQARDAAEQTGDGTGHANAAQDTAATEARAEDTDEF